MSMHVGDVKRHGRHYTPRELAWFLAERGVAYLSESASSVRVLDPACGDGELLLAAAQVLSQRGNVRVDLVGFDLDAGAVAEADRRLRAAGLAPHLKVGDFLQSELPATEDRFDLVITNPPYVRTQALGGDVAREMAAKHGLRGRVDLTHAFVALAPHLLCESGTLALLCSNRFLSTKAGSNVREVLIRDFSVQELYDLGDTKLFSAAVLPAVVIAGRSRSSSSRPLYVRAYEDRGTGEPIGGPLFEELQSLDGRHATIAGKKITIDRGQLETGANSTSPWRMATGASEARLQQIRQGTWKTFGQLGKIRVGIKTTADPVFISGSWEELGGSCPEDELLLPLLTHSNLTAWNPPRNPVAQVLYPYDLEKERRTLLDLTGYPKTRAYFAQHEARLRSRTYVTDAGREWYEIWVPQKPALWRAPKIVFPDISELPRFAIDRSGAIVNGDCYWISIPELPSEDIAHLMVGVANSALAVEFYDHVCGNKLYSGRRRWITQYVNLLPVPEPSSAEARRIVELTKALIMNAGARTPEALAELDDAVERAFAVATPPADMLF